MLEDKAECAVPVYGSVQADHAHGEGHPRNSCASRRTTVLLGTLCVACCMLMGVTLHWVNFRLLFVLTLFDRITRPCLQMGTYSEMANLLGVFSSPQDASSFPSWATNGALRYYDKSVVNHLADLSSLNFMGPTSIEVLI